MLPLLLAAVALNPQPCGVVRDSCERVEINSVCQPPSLDWDAEGVRAGTVSMTQLVFWADCCDSTGTPLVVDWRIYREPTAVFSDRVIFQDGDTLREVRFRSLDRTWTPDDSEIVNREVLAKEKRRGLSSGRAKR